MVHQFNGTYIASTGTCGSETGKFDCPNSLGTAQDGSLYVCDSENHRIQVFNHKLTFLLTDCGEFNWPSNVAIASDGNVYVTKVNNQCLTSGGDHIRFLGRLGNGTCELSRPNVMHILGSHLFCQMIEV